VRVVLISDSHELHRELAVPPGDLLIHAGDFTWFSKWPSTYRNFNLWLGTLPHRHKVVIPGNHEYLLEEPRERSAITNAVLLVDSGVEVEGLRIWGSPVTPLYSGAFGMSRASERRRHWARIPEGLDVLITHGPPFGILDEVGAGRHDGDPELLEAVLEAKPKLHVFGHIHTGYGTARREGTLFINASIFGEDGRLRQPIVIETQAEPMVTGLGRKRE